MIDVTEVKWDDKEDILKEGWVPVAYGDWKYAKMELALRGKIVIVVRKGVTIDGPAPFPVGAYKNVIVRVEQGHKKYVHTEAFEILGGGNYDH